MANSRSAVARTVWHKCGHLCHYETAKSLCHRPHCNLPRTRAIPFCGGCSFLLPGRTNLSDDHYRLVVGCGGRELTREELRFLIRSDSVTKSKSFNKTGSSGRRFFRCVNGKNDEFIADSFDVVVNCCLQLPCKSFRSITIFSGQQKSAQELDSALQCALVYPLKYYRE